MNTVTVKIASTKQKEYPIFIGKGIIGKINELFDISSYSHVLVVTDTTIESLFLPQLLGVLPLDTATVVLESGEKFKTLQSVDKIWKAMHATHLDRKSLVINFGGGVITDIGGFAASTYMRGIDFLNIPTTLLSQVDASIGGKTAIDFDSVKNLIGTFAQPVGVVIDIETIRTLPEREFISGFAEIVKHGIIVDKKYFEQVSSKSAKECSDDELISIIKKSCEIKSKIISSDATEKGDRKLLNFGHSVGHALEALSLETKKPLLHGEAVSIGMVIEAKISELVGLLSKEEFLAIKNGLIKVGLPTTIPKVSISEVLKKLSSDKKNEKNVIKMTLLKRIGNAVIDQIVEEALIERVMNLDAETSSA